MNRMNQANQANKYDWYNQERFDLYLQNLKNKANSGDVASMINVATLYHEGIINYDLFKRRDVVNLLPNYSEALKWYQMAAEHDHLDALQIMGDHELSRKNEQVAFAWFQRGAEKGDGYCLKKLGDIYRQFNDSDKAYHCYNAALKKWQVTAIVGMIYLNVCG